MTGRFRSLLIASATSAFALLVCAVNRLAAVQRADAAVSALAYRTAVDHPGWLTAMRSVTVLGSTAVLVPATIALGAVLMWRRHWRRALFAALGMTAALLVRLVLVAVIARPRPADRLASAANWSFPSGHSTASAAFALVLVMACGPLLGRRWQRAVLGTVALGLAGTVGVSRVALVVHWPTDVLGAWLLVAALIPAAGSPALVGRQRLPPGPPSPTPVQSID